jgi:hypothetical protein
MAGLVPAISLRKAWPLSGIAGTSPAMTLEMTAQSMGKTAFSKCA